jgi:hypothetical protein
LLGEVDAVAEAYIELGVREIITVNSIDLRKTRSRYSDGGGPITAVRPERRQDAAIPFVGFAEGYVLATFRHAGVPLQRIRPAIDALKLEIGVNHALASQTAT